MPDEVERDELVMTLVESALERPSDEREPFLQAVCGGNQELHREVRTRVEWEERMGAFLREPLLAARELVDRPFEPGALIADRFCVVRQIGRGGMGIVYEAVDTKLDRRIAIKCGRIGHRDHLPPEVRAAREVSHFNVCKVHELHTAQTDAGEIEFLTMEFIEGETLASRLRGPNPPGENEAREIVLQIAAGLGQAHRQGVVHGDLKPANIIIAPLPGGGQRVVLMDFGLAKMGQAAGAHVMSRRGGTYRYMAPELHIGARATIASDIFAFGVMIRQLLSVALTRPEGQTARRPAPGPDSTTVTQIYRAGEELWECDVESLPPPWSALVRQATAPDPEQRFHSAEELAARLVPRRTKNKWLLAGAALLAAIAGFGLWQGRQPVWQPVRLAILPPVVEGRPAPVASGVLYDVAARLSGLRRGFVVLPPADARQFDVGTPEQAAKVLGATHALRTNIRHRGSQLVLHASLVDAVSGEAVRNLDGTYPESEPGGVAKALIATVTGGFGLSSPVSAESVAPAAYSDYIQGVSLLRRDNDSADDAMRFFAKAEGSDPMSALPPAGLAEAQLLRFSRTRDRSWLDRAQASAARARSLNPDSFAVLLVQGQLKIESGRYEQAALDFARATQLDPGNPDAWDRLAHAYELQNRPADAVATFRRALEVQPDYFRHYQLLFKFYWYRGQFPQAEETIRKLVLLAPGLYTGHTNLGSVLSDEGRLAEAETEIRESLRLRNTYVATYLLGIIYYYERRFPEAAGQLEKAVAFGNPEPGDYIALASAYRPLGRDGDVREAYHKGIAIAEETLARNPRDAFTRSELALMAAFLGDRGRAQYELAQALQMAPDFGQFVANAALTYELLGQHAEAMAALRNAPTALLRKLMLDPDFDTLRRDPGYATLLATNSDH